MTHLLLMRHGEASDVAGRCIGHTDVPLSPQGAKSIHAVANRWLTTGVARPTRIISSDLRRAADSATILATAWEIPVDYDPRLREMNFGAWDGRTWEELQSTDRERLDRWMESWTDIRTPDGECARDLSERATSWLTSTLVEAQAAQAPLPILVVSHAGWIRAALCALLERPLSEMFTIPVEHGRVLGLEIETSVPARGRLWGDI